MRLRWLDKVQREDFCRTLDEAIKDENLAVREYDRMARVLEDSENPGYRALAVAMVPISKDEKKHGETLETIKRLVCSV